MAFFHAVMWLDHQSAQVLQMHAGEVQKQHLKAHHHNTCQHASDVRTQHRFFGDVCDALAGIGEVLVLGSHQTLSDFRHYVDKHRPATAKQIAGWEPAERLTEGQLLALARRYFAKYDRMAGTPASA
jgi:hypothetical protein